MFLPVVLLGVYSPTFSPRLGCSPRYLWLGAGNYKQVPAWTWHPPCIGRRSRLDRAVRSCQVVLRQAARPRNWTTIES